MPIYEYKCEECTSDFEVFLGINDPSIKECPKCKSTNIRKLVSNCSFQLKGTGWYVTDYAKKDSGNGENKDQQPEAKSGKASETKDSSKTTAGKDKVSKDTSSKADPGKAA